MADTFGIFREDSVPVLRDAQKDHLPFIKGKGRALNIKKKALGDVSNIVSFKGLNSKPIEVGGKLASSSCNLSQQGSLVSCQPITKVEAIVEDPSEALGFCPSCDDSDYDILPLPERLSEKTLNLFCNNWHLYSPPISPKKHLDVNLPDMTYASFLMPYEMECNLPTAVDIPMFEM